MENIKEKIEDKVIDCIALGARGRFVVFKPEKSDKDLIVEKRSEYEKKVISLNVYGTESASDESLLKEVSLLAGKKDFKAEKNFYLLFVYFDIVKQKISDKFFVIPSLDLSRLLEGNRGSSIESGQKLASEKSFAKVLIDQKNFVRFLIDEFNKKSK